jgi:hypothetical protein
VKIRKLYGIFKVEKKIKDLQEEIYSLLDINDMKITSEILKLSEELDGIINIWFPINKRKSDVS